MGMEGIGARVVRKEDNGSSPARANIPTTWWCRAMKQAHFVRSPHAHARIKSIDTSAAEKMPGVIGNFSMARSDRGRHRQHHLRLDDPFQGWLAHEHGGSGGRWPRIPCAMLGDAVAIVVADTKAQARDAAEAVVVEYETLPVVNQRGRGAQGGRAADPPPRPRQPDL